jgi:predicted ester cyclase
VSEFDALAFARRLIDEVWNAKRLDRLYDALLHRVVCHTPRGDLFGRDDYVRRETALLAAFPDWAVAIDDVFAAPEPLHGGTALALVCTASGTHDGHGLFAAPTGKRVACKHLARWRVVDGRVVELWEATGWLAIVRQIGGDLPAAAQALHAELRASASPLLEPVPGEIGANPQQMAPAPVPPPMPEAAPEQRLRGLFQAMWNRRALGDLEHWIAPKARLLTSTDRTLAGIEDIRRDALARLASFPDLAMLVEDIVVPPHAAAAPFMLRWRFHGTHAGDGPLGAPTRKRLSVFGLTAGRIEGGKIVAATEEYDELALLARLAAPLQLAQQS